MSQDPGPFSLGSWAEGEAQVFLHGCLAEFFFLAFYLALDHMDWEWGLGVSLPALKECVPGSWTLFPRKLV